MNIQKYKKIKIFNINKTPIYVGWSLYPVLVLMLIGLFSEISFFVGAACWWGVMLLHELGHMRMAARYNLPTLEIQLHLIHGLCLYEESEFAYENFMVAWGGIFAQLSIAIPCILTLYIFGSHLEWYFLTPLIIFGPLSLIGVAINVLPSEGLDGQTCWKSIPLYLKHRKSKINKKKNPFKVVK